MAKPPSQWQSFPGIKKFHARVNRMRKIMECERSKRDPQNVTHYVIHNVINLGSVQNMIGPGCNNIISKISFNSN